VDNKIMLITYADSLGKNLKELKEIVDGHFREEIGAIHILPFYPSSADRGFAPMTYREVDPAFGTWEDIKAISKDYQLMFDFMINHISRSSKYYQDFVENKEQSPYKDYFIRYSDFWEHGFPTQEEIDLIYKRKPRAPYIDIDFKDGSSDKLWCTFDEEQVDLDVSKKATIEFIRDNLLFLADAGASMIRLDAFAYAIKKKGTNCFFIEPDIWILLKTCEKMLEEKGVEVLPEIHEHYSIQMKIAEHDLPVYDFALPMLVLHGLYAGTNKRLKHWLNICPRHQYTTLDTHDGIGVVDVKDLMGDDEIEFTRDQLYEKGANVKRKYSSSEYKNLDIYQINCTYYSALGNDDAAYLLARAIQFFAPGIPQVYYVGLLAGENDIDLLEKTKNGRDINRHYYSKDEVVHEVKRPVVQDILALMRFRNQYEAFDGEINIDEEVADHELRITWTKNGAKAVLQADLQSKAFCIEYIDVDTKQWRTIVLPSQQLKE
jgi:sucrose phosphorylase